jgi:nucleotide-binding universal stress UspA family protein
MASTAPQTRIQLRNILYCTDFSEAASHALPYATEFAQHFGSKLYGLHVHAPDASPGEALGEFDKAQATEKIRNQIGKLPGIQTEILIKEGDLWSFVSTAIQEKQIDLLVMGTRGRTGIKKFLLGSAAEEIFRRATCAVLTVGPHAPSQPARRDKISEILYAVDFSPESLAAAPYAISLAQEYQANLTLLHVIAAPKAGDLITTEQLQSSTEKRLHELVPAGSELWCKPHCIVGQGPAADEIVSIAAHRNADLIILGVRRPHGAATHLPIATAHKVVSHAACPVLTVRG